MNPQKCHQTDKLESLLFCCEKAAPLQSGKGSVDSVSKITRSISCGYAIHTDYHSRSSNKKEQRTLFPLAIVFDGKHWIFRAYNENDGRFKNFSFTNALNVIEDSSLIRDSFKELAQDKEWNTQVPLLLIPHKNLTKQQQQDIKLDFGIKANSLDNDFNNTIIRLLKVLHNDLEAKVLGPAIVEEIVYRALVGDNGHILFDLARHDGHYARIARVLGTLHKGYAELISVEHLAEQVHMSVSGFHRAFRQVTSETPLQYLKKIRLNKAKDLIVIEGKQATEAATLVGYSSASQFSREFKRHFNATPKAIGM